MGGVVSERESKILSIIETARAKRAKFRDPHITMSHGAGGKATTSLVEGLFVPAFASPSLDALGDAGTVSVDGLDLALTTDSFVVKPLSFPGGSIGELAVNGTVNDLAMAGARPLALTLSLVLEEGLSADDASLRGGGDRSRSAGGRCSDRGRRHEGGGAWARRRHVHLHNRSRPARSTCHARARSFEAGRSDPPLRLDRRARHSDHARPRRARAGGRHRIGHSLSMAHGRQPCSTPPVLGCAACATPLVAEWPPCSTSSRVPPAWL